MKECPADEKNLDIIRGLGYTIKAVMKFIVGPVAQLGERSVRIREVKGSNPSRSTRIKPHFCKGSVAFLLHTAQRRKIAMRAPYNVLVLPFCRTSDDILYCILKRKDLGIWQFTERTDPEFTMGSSAVCLKLPVSS